MYRNESKFQLYLLINNFLKNNEQRLKLLERYLESVFNNICEGHRTTDRLSVKLHLLSILTSKVKLRSYLMFTYINVIFNI